MSLILNIETALEGATVSLAREGIVLRSEYCSSQKDHAAWLHPAIENMILQEAGSLRDLQAVAVSIGPGSYTGLRVGLSSAKGFCYALGIPLITVGTLEILATAVQDEAKDCICPMIDARRMEVYAALYSSEMKEIMPPHAVVLDANSFQVELSDHSILFCGPGCQKLQPLLSHPNAAFSMSLPEPPVLARMSFQYFRENKFADLAYTEPLYIKEFYTTTRRN